MRKPSLRKQLEMIDERVLTLTKQIREKADPIAIGKTVAMVHLDIITRIVAQIDQLDIATDYSLCVPDLTLAENCARGCAVLSIQGRLLTMLVNQFDRLLKCCGGADAIAVQYIIRWAKEDPSHLEWLLAFADAKRSRRKS